ncbi:MAG: hypothetical protein EA350_02545 [Gemmatimonadales bacterium]|nr:MAG: hypothetical protein EA350_02545 [Gemmatimonadales bacterium]
MGTVSASLDSLASVIAANSAVLEAGNSAVHAAGNSGDGSVDPVVVVVASDVTLDARDTIAVSIPGGTVEGVRDTLFLVSAPAGEDVSGLVSSLDSLRSAIAHLHGDGLAFQQGTSTLLLRGLGVGLQLFLLFALIGTWLGSLRANTYLKGQEVALAYHERFMKLMDEKSRIVRIATASKSEPSRLKTQADLFYSKFWFLNHQEFSFWRQGLIRDEQYKFWLRRRIVEYCCEDPYLGSGALPSFKEGWYKVARKEFEGTDFQSFVDILLVSRNPDELVKRYGPEEGWLRRRQFGVPMAGNLDETSVPELEKAEVPTKACPEVGRPSTTEA